MCACSTQIGTAVVMLRMMAVQSAEPEINSSRCRSRENTGFEWLWYWLGLKWWLIGENFDLNWFGISFFEKNEKMKNDFTQSLCVNNCPFQWIERERYCHHWNKWHFYKQPTHALVRCNPVLLNFFEFLFFILQWLFKRNIIIIIIIILDKELLICKCLY